MGSGDDTEPEVELDDEDVAQLLYTSGTTAAPKGAMLTHRALMSEYVSCIAALEYHPDDRAIAALPLYTRPRCTSSSCRSCWWEG